MIRGLALLAVCAALGCIKPPEIVMVDQATALEEQAGGSFDDVERGLDRAAVEPRPVALTSEQLEALGVRSGPRADDAGLTEADRLDELLVQQCVGEGLDGLVVAAGASCRGAVDADEVDLLVARVNRARRQLWRWMRARRSEVAIGDLRRAWREAHLRGVVCGARVEVEKGQWTRKPC